MDFENEDWLTDEEKAEQKEEYNRRYESEYLKLTKQMSEDEFDDVTRELFPKHNIARSNNPEMDAQYNLGKAQKAVDEKNQLDDSSQAFLDHIGKADGKSRRELKKWAKDALKGEGPSYLRG